MTNTFLETWFYVTSSSTLPRSFMLIFMLPVNRTNMSIVTFSAFYSLSFSLCLVIHIRPRYVDGHFVYTGIVKRSRMFIAANGAVYVAVSIYYHAAGNNVVKLCGFCWEIKNMYFLLQDWQQ
jgi:hypothetical protein